MKAVYNPQQDIHNPKFFLVHGQVRESAETPLRAELLMEALTSSGIEILPSKDFGEQPRLAIHTSQYLDFLAVAHEQWQELPSGGSPEIIPNVHPSRYKGSYPEGIVGRAGWHMLDTACPIGERTYEAACISANSALTAAELILNGEQSAYALCRPPGHHAYADMAGGFCFLNNAAIAAQFLRKEYKRVAILDVDVHHGNGTQGIFYRRADVFTASIHCDPSKYYPFFWGYDHEIGEVEGRGFNCNIPLPSLSEDAIFLKAVDMAKRRIENFDAGALVLSLGLDASEEDPLKGLAVTTYGFYKIGVAIAALNLPTLLVQEGGYASEILSNNLEAFMAGFLGKPYTFGDQRLKVVIA